MTWLFCSAFGLPRLGMDSQLITFEWCGMWCGTTRVMGSRHCARDVKGTPGVWRTVTLESSRLLSVTPAFCHVHFRLTSLIHYVPRAMPLNVIIWEYNSRRVQHGITLVACCIFFKHCFLTCSCLLAPSNASHLYTGFLFWINLCHVDLSISFMPCTQPLSVGLFCGISWPSFFLAQSCTPCSPLCKSGVEMRMWRSDMLEA